MAIRKTKSTMQGWTKIGKSEYRHVNGHRVRKTASGWEVIGPNRCDGFIYCAMWAAMSAAAGTPAEFAN